jgi:hypothetical protein
MRRRFAVGIVTMVGAIVACIEPRQAPDEGPSDAGIAALIAPHAPCIMQEGGLAPATDCQAIDIVETTIPMVGAGSGTAMVRAFTSTPTMLMTATITGPSVYTFTEPSCTGMQTCTFGPQALPYTLGVQCGSPAANALLTVQGTNGMMDTDSAQLTCASPGPTISVSPSMIGPLMSPVGTPTPPEQITVTNNGSGTLSYTVSNSDPQWQLSSGCTGFPNCMLPGGGSQHVFDLTFTPNAHHITPDTDTFTFDGGVAGMPTVQVSGMGTGAVLDVSPTSHDFLQLARNALGTQQITITNQGNAPLDVMIAGAAPPFGASSMGFNDIMPSSSVTFDATCQSATAITPAVMGSIVITSNAYSPSGGSQMVSLQCEVLATDLQVDPNPVDFTEVRKGTSPAPTMDVTLFNASGAAETVTSVQLAGHPNALSRSGFSGGEIPASSSRTVTLTLATGSEVDLAGSRLEIALAGQPTPLAVPVRGKVVVPSARVQPETLDLGTACIASQVTGVVRMVNDGSATLTLQRPTMDQAFNATSTSMFPLALAASNEASVEVTPAMMTAGASKGVLTWQVDALGEPFQTFTVPVDLEYIPEGTAVSPRKLEFGQLDVDLLSPPSTVTLRNCDPNPVAVRVEGLVSTRGNLDAWEIEPRIVERLLASQETLTITARFSPKRPGRHEAQIMLRVGDQQRFVEITGDGVGALLDKTSLYACDCSGAGRPYALAPIGFVVFAIIVRRRRRC